MFDLTIDLLFSSGLNQPDLEIIYYILCVCNQSLSIAYH